MYYSRRCDKKDTIFVLLTFGSYRVNKGKKCQIFWKKNRKCLELSLDTLYASPWRGGRVVEGAPLLRE